MHVLYEIHFHGFLIAFTCVTGPSLLKQLVKIGLSALLAVCPFAGANAENVLDPTPMAMQEAGFEQSGPAVDALNFEFSVLGGAFQRNVLGTASTAMFTASIATPLGEYSNFGAQLDLAGGIYAEDYLGAASGLHLFWRDPAQGAIGIYADWAYVNPEHGGRIGGEFAAYNGRWSLDALVGIQFGQQFFTEFIDEVDLSYYFTENTRGSIGHRLSSRGHVGNISFEHLMTEEGLDGWSVFGEVEAGEDNYVAGFGGIRFAFGSTGSTLIERDRQSGMQVRVPRNLASVTQCGFLRTPRPSTFFRGQMSNLCSSEDEINKRSNRGIVKQ